MRTVFIVCAVSSVLITLGCKPNDPGRPPAAPTPEQVLAKLDHPVRVGRVVLVPSGYRAYLGKNRARLSLVRVDPGPGDEPWDTHLDCQCQSSTEGLAGGVGGLIVIGVDGAIDVQGSDAPGHSTESGGCTWEKAGDNWHCLKTGDCQQPSCTIGMHSEP